MELTGRRLGPIIVGTSGIVIIISFCLRRTCKPQSYEIRIPLHRPRRPAPRPARAGRRHAQRESIFLARSILAILALARSCFRDRRGVDPVRRPYPAPLLDRPCDARRATSQNSVNVGPCRTDAGTRRSRRLRSRSICHSL